MENKVHEPAVPSTSGSSVGNQRLAGIELPNVAVMTASKADLVKRAIALLIDGVIGAVLSFFPYVGGLAAAVYWLSRDGLDVEFMQHRSVGKKLMKLRPLMLNGASTNLEASIKRNWMFAIGGLASVVAYLPIVGWLLIIPLSVLALALVLIEVFLVVTDGGGRRMGDRFAGTRVIETTD
jgi:hypothetical protein